MRIELALILGVMLLSIGCASSKPNLADTVQAAACDGYRDRLSLVEDDLIDNDPSEEQMSKMLVCAATDGDLTVVDDLLDRGAHLAMNGASGRSALTEAARVGHQPIVAALLAHDVNVNEAGPVLLWTPLMYAAAEGHGTVVGSLLDAGADPNLRNRMGRTALMFAARYGFTEIAEQLLQGGAEVNLVPSRGKQWTALTAAAYRGHVETVQLLIDHGADLGKADVQGKTALMWAEAEGHSKVASTLRSGVVAK